MEGSRRATAPPPRERVAIAAIAAGLTWLAVLPWPGASRTPQTLVAVPVAQTTLREKAVAAPPCDHGKPDVAWGIWLVPVDTKCLQTAKAVGIVFHGPMRERTGDEFLAKLKEARDTGRIVAFVRMTSPGGDLRSGLAIGKALGGMKGIPIEVPRWCASACAVAVLGAGPGRLVLCARRRDRRAPGLRRRDRGNPRRTDEPHRC